MRAELPAAVSATVEQEVIARVAAAKIRLRFDKAVVRLVNRMKSSLATAIPDDQAIVFTVTAPIRLPARTAASLESLVRSGLTGSDLCTTVNGNRIQVRRITGVLPNMPRVLGFVHNPEADAGRILELAESRLHE